MSEKHSTASKQRWAKIPKEKRSEKMATVALDRWKDIPENERQVVANKLVEAKKVKRTV